MTHAPIASRQLQLPAGIVIELEEYGVPDGPAVLFFHGWPSAARQGALLDQAARDLGLRIIAPSRPGLAASQPQANRKLVDWPPLVREIATALGLSRFHVLGISGGGPYALACAWALPDSIAAAAVVCGAPPLAELATRDGFNPAYRALLGVYDRHRSSARWLFRLLHHFGRWSPPQWMLLLLRGALVGPDRDTLADPEISRMCYAGFRAAWGKYRDGVFEDAEIYTQPWGFPLEEIRIPVRVWHGTEDRNFSHDVTDYAQRIPGVEIRIMAEEGHYSLPIRRAPEILADLVAAGADRWRQST